MTYYRVYARDGVKAGVLCVPEAVRGAAAVQRVVLPGAQEFQALWDKAIERPVVLDTAAAPELQ